MDVFIKIVQLVFALSLLIFVHEMGHFLFARLFKIRIDKFYLFFNPSFSLLRAKRINGKWQLSWLSSTPPAEWQGHEDKTEWGLGWLPLGGYCKIAGMIDESMDKEQMKQAPQPWEYRTKPAWQRLFVIAGGVVFNVIFAFFIFWGMLFTWGEKYLANKDAIYGIQCDSLAQEMGFRNGDRILYLDKLPVESFSDIVPDIIFNQVKTVTLIRENDTLTVPITDRFLPVILKGESRLFEPRVPFVIQSVPETSLNAKSGLQQGDKVIGIDSVEVSFFRDVQTELAKNKGQAVQLRIIRNDSLHTIPVTVSDKGTIDVYTDNKLASFFTMTQKNYGFFSAFPAGIRECANTIRSYIKQLKLIFSPKTEAYKSVGSFITIANIFPGQWDWQSFWSLTAFLSIMLAVLNILPIPGLDGGHLVFALYEMVTRRKPSDKVYEIAQWIGFILLIGIMVMALGNDIIRFVLPKIGITL